VNDFGYSFIDLPQKIIKLMDEPPAFRSISFEIYVKKELNFLLVELLIIIIY